MDESLLALLFRRFIIDAFWFVGEVLGAENLILASSTD
jgi:hypothetical protein